MYVKSLDSRLNSLQLLPYLPVAKVAIISKRHAAHQSQITVFMRRQTDRPILCASAWCHTRVNDRYFILSFSAACIVSTINYIFVFVNHDEKIISIFCFTKSDAASPYRKFVSIYSEKHLIQISRQSVRSVTELFVYNLGIFAYLSEYKHQKYTSVQQNIKLISVVRLASLSEYTARTNNLCLMFVFIQRQGASASFR